MGQEQTGFGTTNKTAGVLPTQTDTNIFVRRSSGLLREMNSKYAFSTNILSAGFFYSFLYIIWGAVLFPGANLAEAALIGIVLNIPIALLYYYFTVIMPRSGGDYIWISRTVFPIVGFVLNLGMIFAMLIWLGSDIPIAIQDGLAPMLYALGLTSGNAIYITVAHAVNNSTVIVAITIIWLLIIGFILTRKTKIFGRVLWAFFIVAIAADVIYMVSLVLLGHTAFVNNFNRYSGMNYNTLMSLGASHHYPLSAQVGATLFSTVYIYLNFLGVVFTAYYSGEMKNVQRSAMYSIVLSTIFFGLVLAAMYSSAYYVFGFGFNQTIAILSQTGNAAWTLPYTPFPNFLIMLGYPNSPIGIIVTIGFMVNMIAAMPAYLFVASRNLFAYSFDRIIPSFFARVSKGGAPYGSAILITIIGVVISLLYIYTPAFEYFLYSTTLMLIIYAFVGAMAIFFPFIKRSIFESAPGFIKKKIGGVPVLSIIGFLGAASALYGIVASFLPAFGGVMSPASLAFTFSVYIIGIIVYIAAHYLRKAKGLPLEYSFKEIPPL
ncbi:MAG: APC family permease [Thermoplasmatales archaeon]